MITCSGVTRQAIPCLNAALPGSEPPRCRHHLTAVLPAQPVVQAHEEPRDLTTELRLVRDVLSRLADRLDDPTYTLLPDDLRTLATLIFNGVRTVAYLIGRQSDESTEFQSWLDQALDTLSTELEADL